MRTAFICACAIVSSAQAQIPIGIPGRLGQTSAQASGQLPVLPSARSVAAAGDGLVLEGPVDPTEYIVGPGDVFTVAIGGSVPRQVPAVVGADGTLVVPEAGSFDTAGRTLARVLREVQSALQRRYANVPANLSLSSPRRFYVHVAGSVPQPGRQLVPAIARVEDAIVQSSGADINQTVRYTQPVVRAEAPRWPALRNVTVTDPAGRTRSVDLMRYFATGDLSQNPYLRDGDALYVPAFDPLSEGVLVGGAVDRPGTYDARPGDTALDLLVVASGADPAARAGRVRRVRPGSGGAADDREVAFADAASLDVRPRDQVYAVPAEPEADRVEVAGAVRYPGLYPITSGTTTLGELVAMAGGLRDDALVRGATLQRPVRDLTSVPQQQRAAPDPTVPVRTQTEIDADLAASVSLGDDTPSGGLFSRQYFAREVRQVPRVSIDPERALSGAETVRLRGGDRLDVPFDDGLIRVFGRVRQSGYVPFTPGASASDYVARAGGADLLATSVYVVDVATGGFTEGAEAPVLPGDAVFVNSLPSPDNPAFAQIILQERQSEREDARDRRQTRFQFITALVGIVGTVASVIIAYTALQRVP